MTAPWTATWRQGQEYLTVIAADGRTWPYDVTPDQDKPLHTFLPPTPWCAYPGTRWVEEDTGTVPAVWEPCCNARIRVRASSAITGSAPSPPTNGR